MLPNFFVVGVQKAATTSLHNYLIGHPEIYLPESKETKFFVDDLRYSKGIGFYRQTYFSDWKGEKAIGEIDPDIIYFDYAAGRIGKHMDTAKIRLIISLRNPIDRAFSHYLMTHRRGLEPLCFEEAIAIENRRIEKGYKEKMHYSYLTRGFYYQQIERLMTTTGNMEPFIMLSDDLKTNKEGALNAIFEYLDVATGFVPKNPNREYHQARIPRSTRLLNRVISETPEKRLIRFLIPFKGLRHKIRQKLIAMNETEVHKMVLHPDTRKRLVEIYRRDNSRLEQFLHRDLSHWNA